LITDCGCVPTNDTISNLKSIVEIATLIIAVVGAFIASVTYRNNSKRERAKWAVQLFEKFYESDSYKEMRDKLDCTPNAATVQGLVDEESSEFTDYLNFFEMVTFLAKSNQLTKSDVHGLFQYYLNCLKRHRAVMVYLHNEANGFEYLKEFLGTTAI